MLVSADAFAQQFLQMDPSKISAITTKKKQLGYGTTHFNLFFNNSKNETGKIIDAKSAFHAVSPRFVVDNWGIVCRQELKMQRSLGLPLYFRLGSLQQVDALEGKLQPQTKLIPINPAVAIH